MRAWRITRETRGSDAFDGEGARLFGGRWNSPGTPVVYLSKYVSTAILEILVHGVGPSSVAGHVTIGVDVPDDVVVHDVGRLPRNWRESPPPEQTQIIGDLWVRSGRSALLRVPSAVLPDAHSDETNLLLNPRHPDAMRLVRTKPSALLLDARLRTR